MTDRVCPPVSALVFPQSSLVTVPDLTTERSQRKHRDGASVSR
jgi:hypothetical protein